MGLFNWALPSSVIADPQSTIANRQSAKFLSLSSSHQWWSKAGSCPSPRCRACWIAAADHINGGRVAQLDGIAEIAVGIDFGGELAVRIDDERKVHLVRGGEFLCVSAQPLG